jgi:hypothetical protein
MIGSGFRKPWAKKSASNQPLTGRARKPPPHPLQARPPGGQDAHPRPGASRSRRRERSPSPTTLPWWLFVKGLPYRVLSWFTGNSPVDLEWELIPAPNQPDLTLNLRLPRWVAAYGGRFNFIIKSNHQRRRLKIVIPPGVKDGSRLRVKGAGKRRGPRRGHLYINIRLKD